MDHMSMGERGAGAVLPGPAKDAGRRDRRPAPLLAAGIAAAAVLLGPAAARASCASPVNAIEAENCLTGTPQSTWAVSGAGDSTIQGFATDISLNRGGTVQFKVKTTASAYRLDIYRMGYYQGRGARLVATVLPSASLPQSQPSCLTDSTGLIDCGNWAASASWAVPAGATSGIYFARAVRTDTGGASHIFFVVRDDASTSDILFQTSDTTWQAYNDYGGNSLYSGNGGVGRAYKVSYNRPFHTAVFEAESWVFAAEYPMVRWLEANAYDVSYTTGVDSDRRGALIRNHKLWISNGHDEYWSGAQRANVEAARDAGVHLAFFSGNKIFWKTRWESDGSGNPYRTMVCYKETHANAVIDPADPPTWTGTWRDPRFSPPADGGRPENALAGNIFKINGPYSDAIAVPQADGRMRLWRNTSIAALGTGQTATLAPGTLGFEVDTDEDNGFRPPGLFGVSTNPISTSGLYLLDYGSSYGAGNATHRVTIYRHASGALVFSTGSYTWSWGLDANHDLSAQGSTTDVRMQQATVNLLADMGTQPGALQAGLVAATASSDATSPTSQITSPAAGATLSPGSTVSITGTATDAGGGVVGGVEVSTDGGTTWHPATGRESWSYGWTVSGSGTVTLRSRAVDDSGNLEVPSAGRSVTVGGAVSGCTSNCSLWPSATVPGLADGGPDSSVELGVKFRSDVAGSVAGIRFYKASTNTGTHVANLWTSTGTRLATVTFTGETGSGWQQMNFASPVAISANTVYVASYLCPNGHYSDDLGYFTGTGRDAPPLHALADGVSGGDGVYAYGATSTFPSSTWNASNYWVDVVFNPTPTATLTSIAVTPGNQTLLVGATQQMTATGTYSDGTTQTLTSGVAWASSSAAVASVDASGLATARSGGSTTISATSGGVTGGTSLVVQPAALSIATAALPDGMQYQAYSATLAASGGTPPYMWSITGGALPAGLTLDGGTGAIAGTPSAAGTSTFDVQLRDSGAQFAIKTLSIAVSAAPALAVATAALPGATQGAAYSATLAASGGVPPYTWSIASGLPPGLSLAPSTGVISGAPTTPGTYPFTAQVTDSAAQTAARALSIAVAQATSVTIWPATAVPSLVDGGPDSPVELGVKFRSDVAGSVTGIRFYKASANTGTHVGSLWTSGGAKLATATFSGETASGWQQVSFAAPVSISANTVYVASYHASSGHYSADVGYFASSGVDNPPLHALANGVSGGNGVYAYGSTSSFPNLTWQSANYWVDVVFSSAPAVTLTSIAVTPAAPTVVVGATQQFAATGTYSDGSTKDVTGSATWASSSTAVATVSSAGLATAVGAGTTTISATSAGVTGSTSLTVQPAPLSVATASLPGGTQFVAYSASLSASGGTPPYTWSLSSGSLPPGLTLNASSGAISGTPSTAGAFGFTAQVTDSALQTATRALSISVAAAPALAVSTASLPGGNQYQAYSATLAATGGLTPYTWSIPGGGLPPGLTLAASTGVISGTPTASGAYGFTVQVADSASQTATKALSITVAAAPPLAITTTALPGGTQGSPYSATLAASGGLTPYTWSIPAGLPPGLSLAPATGVVSGTPTTAGAFSFATQVTDAASSTASATLSITVVPPGNYTLWPSQAVPGLADAGADSSVELGVKFRADQAGYITGIRFYKSVANTGTHVGSLWTSTGTRLASATFASETPSGWQQVNFAAPVAISANTVYVASYHANSGHYAADAGYFASGWDNLPLHALADGASGGNGVYRYGSSSAFPNLTFQSANYWVDVVFNPSSPVPSLSSISVSPPSATLAIGATQQFTATATYSDGASVDVTREATWTSSDLAVAAVGAGGVATAVASGTATISATLSGVAGGASLTVSPPPPPPDEGPGGPILVVSGTAAPFSRYLAEILRTEGFQEFLAKDISTVTSTTLASYDLVVLGDVPLTAAQATMFVNWVNGGGNLVAMHPDKQLAGLLGLADAGGTLSNGYLLVDTSAPPGAGLVGQTIQFHGSADLYDLAGATAIATLYSTATASTGKPAVTLRTAGAGKAAAFTYDLARSVVYTRQGNPAWSGQERDGITPVRSDDLFYGAAVFDPRPDWIDLGKVAIPQADEQQRLLANLLLQMNLAKKPLPRFWYLPSGFKAAVVMTGDDHANGGTKGRFDAYIAASPSGCSVADWQCIRSTSYLYPNSPLTNTQAQSYTSLGFEVSVHVTTGCSDYSSYDDLDTFYYVPQLADFASKYTSIPAPITHRMHCIAWSDYDTQAQVDVAHGIRLDTTYYYWPPGWVADRPGFFTGSGMPMRFALRTGQTAEIYQAATQMTDESDQTYPMTIDTLLDNATGPLGYYGVFTANMHTDAVASTGSDAIVASAKARGVPVVSAKQMLQWLDGRNASSFGSLSWNGSTLSFTVSAASGSRNLRALLPAQAGARQLARVTRNGTGVAFATQTIKGVSYGIFPAASGSYQATYQ